MKLKYLLLLLAAYIPTWLSAQTITLFDGTGGFVVDEWTLFDYDYVGGKLHVEGNGTDMLSVTFDPVYVSNPNQIYLTATLNADEGVYSQVWFYNTDFDRIMKFDAWFETVGLSNTFLLTYADVDENDFFHDISAAEFYMGGSPSQSLEITFESLAAIPEPSTYLLIVSGLLAGTLFFRRRYGQTAEA